MGQPNDYYFITIGFREAKFDPETGGMEYSSNGTREIFEKVQTRAL